MDVTDMVNYNVQLLNPTDLTSSFFCLSKTDPSIGFAFDASKVAGQTYPEQADTSSGKRDRFPFRVFVLCSRSLVLWIFASLSTAQSGYCLLLAFRRTFCFECSKEAYPSPESPFLRSVVVFV
jgi:hypothetical protein